MLTFPLLFASFLVTRDRRVNDQKWINSKGHIQMETFGALAGREQTAVKRL